MTKSTTLALLALLAFAAGCGSAALPAETQSSFPPPGRPGFAFVFSDP